MKSYLNLGCGQRFHPEWTNVDFVAGNACVLSHNLRKGIPFQNEQFDVVYHSHLLEHFPKSNALTFLRDCHRVLRPRGILRIAVPNLERIARGYLQALEEAVQGDEQWRYNYEWMMLELFDQTVRERSGGEMAACLFQERIPNKKFILERIGLEAQRVIESAEQTRAGTPIQAGRKATLGRALHRVYRLLRDSAFRRELMLRYLLGTEYELLQVGRFRRGGELHLWMYDRYSLPELLSATGFQHSQVVGPAESQIPNWTMYNLDTEPDGTVYKPDSLYVEALK